MEVIRARNVHDALPRGLCLLEAVGVRQETRNGPALVVPGPVTTLYAQPRERVLFHPWRDANPFFHLVESIWMLLGRSDVKTVQRYAQNMASFSDDGKTFHGAYGYRWWRHFGLQQPLIIAQKLRDNPEDRRCVMAMWDPEADLMGGSKDLPCNTHIYFSRAIDGRLDMTVCNRSNDVIWGAYGANAVHMSFLQEFMAGAIGCEVGRYWQMSNNYHAYLNVLERYSGVELGFNSNPYDNITPFPIINTPPEQWLEDAALLLDEGVTIGLRDPWFRRVAVPVMKAHAHWKGYKGEERYTGALEIIEQCQAPDWRLACQQWLERRHEKFLRARDDGPAADE